MTHKIQHSLIFFILLMSFSTFAQETDESDGLEDLDDLFETPQDDIIVEESEIDLREQFEVAEIVKFKGSFSAMGIIGAGWNSWNFIHDITDGFDASAGLQSNFTVSVDARPVPQFSIFASLSTAFDPYASLNEAGVDEISSFWTEPTFDSVYLDYILKDTLYTRLGKFKMAWGQGQFYTPGNLMENSGDSALNIRLTIPAWFGLSFVLLTNNSVSYLDFTYGGKIDFVFGETMISPGVTFSYYGGLETILSLKQVLFKTDLLIDFTTHINNQGLESTYVVAGFFREWDNLKLYGEYQFSWLSASGYNHESTLALGWSKPLGAPFNLGLEWMQNYVDGSGMVTLGYSHRIFPYVDLQLALPIVYGVDGSSAVVNNPDPSKRRIALALALKFSGSF